MATAKAANQAKAATTPRILVWDAPVRLTHWLMVTSFFTAYLTTEDDELRWLHLSAGYTLAILVAFRLVWGVIGTRYALFSNFVRGPRAVLGYVRSLRTGHPEHHVGHNPAGAVAVLLLLGMAAIVTASGWVTYRQGDDSWIEEVHELAANLMLAVVVVHVLGVLVGSWLHRENLIGAMFTGKKPGDPSESIKRSMWLVALILLALLMEFWWHQWIAGS